MLFVFINFFLHSHFIFFRAKVIVLLWGLKKTSDFAGKGNVSPWSLFDLGPYMQIQQIIFYLKTKIKTWIIFLLLVKPRKFLDNLCVKKFQFHLCVYENSKIISQFNTNYKINTSLTLLVQIFLQKYKHPINSFKTYKKNGHIFA